MSDENPKSAHYWEKRPDLKVVPAGVMTAQPYADHAAWAGEDLRAENRLLRAATDSLILRIEKAELALKEERAQSDAFQAQVRRLVHRELELLRMLVSKSTHNNG